VVYLWVAKNIRWLCLKALANVIIMNENQAEEALISLIDFNTVYRIRAA